MTRKARDVHLYYVGPKPGGPRGTLGALRGRGALVRRHPSRRDQILAQFDFPDPPNEPKDPHSYPNSMCFGWHPFPLNEFRRKQPTQ